MPVYGLSCKTNCDNDKVLLLQEKSEEKIINKLFLVQSAQ